MEINYHAGKHLCPSEVFLSWLAQMVENSVRSWPVARPCPRSRNETAWIDTLVQAEVMVCVRLSWMALKCGFLGFVCICSKVDTLP